MSAHFEDMNFAFPGRAFSTRTFDVHYALEYFGLAIAGLVNGEPKFTFPDSYFRIFSHRE